MTAEFRIQENDKTALTIQRTEEARRFGTVDASTHLDKEQRAAVDADAGYGANPQNAKVHPVLSKAAQLSGIAPSITPSVPESPEANANYKQLQLANALNLGAQHKAKPSSAPTLTRK